MNKGKNNTKLILKGIGAFMIYFLISQYSSLPFLLMNIEIDSIPQIVKCIYSIIVELIIILIIFLMFKDYIIKCFKDFKKNNRLYFKTYFKYWIIMLALMMIANGTILLIDPNASANNQDTINNLFNNLPIYTFVLSVFLAPIIEEFAFRLSFRAIFKNKYLFIFLSGFLFGSFHVIGANETWIDLLYIIPYSIPGWIFAYTLYKSDNIFVPMSLHFLHNGILMSLQMLLFLFNIGI